MKTIVYLFFLENNDKGPIQHVKAFLRYFRGRVIAISNISRDDIENYSPFYKINVNSKLNLFLKQIKAIFIIRKIILNKDIDYIVIRHSVGVILPFFYLKLKRYKIILEVNGLLFQDLKDRKKSKCIRIINYFFEFIIYHLVDKVVIVHQNLKLPILNRYKLNHGLFLVAQNGVDPINYFSLSEAKKHVGFSLNKIYIGYLGSLAYREGVDILLSYFNRLCLDNVLLCVVGGTKNDFEILLENVNITNNTKDKIIHYSFLPYNTALKYIGACDINVHLRRPLSGLQNSQGSPLKILDYLNVSRPIIASRIDSYNFIEKNKLGILINPYSFEEFQESVKKILNSYNKYDNNKGNKYVKKFHSWEENLKVFETLNNFNANSNENIN